MKKVSEITLKLILNECFGINYSEDGFGRAFGYPKSNCDNVKKRLKSRN